MSDSWHDFLAAVSICCGLAALCGAGALALGIQVGESTPVDVFVLAVMALVAWAIWWWTR